MNLAIVLKRWRVMGELSMRQAGELVGIDGASWGRIERSESSSGENLAKILTWLIAVPQKATPKSEQLPLDSEQSDLEAV